MRSHATFQTKGKRPILVSKTSSHHEGGRAERMDVVCNATRSLSLSKDQRVESDNSGKPIRDAHDVQDNPDNDLHKNLKVAQVLQVIVDAPLDIERTIENFSHDDYADLLEALAETYPRLLVKLVYIYDQNILLVMSLSSLHEGVISRMARAAIKFTNEIGHDQDIYDVPVYLNKCIRYYGTHQQESERKQRRAIPDFQACFEITPLGKPLMIPKWVGEVAFATSAANIRDRLKEIVAKSPSIDLAFLFCIHESPEWRSPSLDDTRAQQLHAERLATYDEFDPTVREDGMKIIWKGFTWISITKISVEVYVRSPEDGKLAIDVGEQRAYSACGTIYPSLSTDRVDQLLVDASRALKDSLLTLMESNGGEAMHIDQVRRSTASLRVPWASFCRQLRSAVMQSAHERYVQCYQAGEEREMNG